MEFVQNSISVSEGLNNQSCSGWSSRRKRRFRSHGRRVIGIFIKNGMAKKHLDLRSGGRQLRTDMGDEVIGSMKEVIDGHNSRHNMAVISWPVPGEEGLDDFQF